VIKILCARALCTINLRKQSKFLCTLHDVGWSKERNDSSPSFLTWLRTSLHSSHVKFTARNLRSFVGSLSWILTSRTFVLVPTSLTVCHCSVYNSELLFCITRFRITSARRAGGSVTPGRWRVHNLRGAVLCAQLRANVSVR
jgi:hypothetical protein